MAIYRRLQDDTETNVLMLTTIDDTLKEKKII